ncbi:hypothetical protein [Leptospira sp. GIMC2001]|uniref:hypothetical protein n=1 Tax=Leptospira sp. GIMC2001 TaxID=1513297 RepID=UPI00234AEC3F|nr:hypothetical protein [Leptospira sp. GIMC2001]WCL51521.1 hypothetical protein O4O04_20100 [Leptospira sp. GIMC2001]
MANDPTLPPVPDTSILVGSNVDVFIDGKRRAFIENVDVDNNYNTEEFYGLGKYFPLDAKSMFYKGNLTGKMHVVTDPEEPGAMNLVDISGILTHKGHEFEFREASTGRRIGRMICKLNTDRHNISNKSATSRDVSFVIIRIQMMEGFN